MKIAIIGIGGVGGYFGTLLANHGLDVTFVARGDTFNALKEKGISLKTVQGSYELSQVNVIDSISKLIDPELVLVCCKTYDLEQVAFELKNIASNKTIIIPLLNGIDVDLIIKKIIPQSKVYPGLTYIVSTKKEPGVFEQTAGPCTIIFGERKVSNNSELKKIEEIFKAAGLKATCAEDIEKEYWKKFIWLTGFSGMTAICRSNIGAIVNLDLGFELIVRCFDEGFTLAKAFGVVFQDTDREEIVSKAINYKHTGTSAKSSLLVDIENKRRNEIESLNGTLIRLAKEKNVAVPLNEIIYLGIKLATN